MSNLAKGSFEQGFSVIGFNEMHTGSDIITGFASDEDWTADEDGERYVTAPVQIDLTEDERTLKDCEDGEVPDGFLYRGVADGELTAEKILGNYPRDEVKAGDTVDYVRFVSGALLQTSIVDEDNVPDKGDDVYVQGGEYSADDTDATAIGVCVEDDDSGQPDGYILIKLD